MCPRLGCPDEGEDVLTTGVSLLMGSQVLSYGRSDAQGIDRPKEKW